MMKFRMVLSTLLALLTIENGYANIGSESERRRIMVTKKRIHLLLVALLSLSGVLPVAATDYQASDYLPLAVGNSWTYTHEYYNVEEGD